MGGWPLYGMGPNIAKIFWMVLFNILYYLALIFLICASVFWGWSHIGVTCYLGFGMLLGFLRCQVRIAFQIQHGDVLTDMICATFFPTFTITQMEKQLGIDADAYVAAKLNVGKGTAEVSGDI